jgi:hypothetical protein
MISHEWATRPEDQRFLSVDELHDYNVAKQNRSLVSDAAIEHLRVLPSDEHGIVLRTPEGNEGKLSNWSFGQLCSRVHAPAGYLRTLPSELATIPLQWSMENLAEDRDAKLLVRRPVMEKYVAEKATISAVTSPSYGRIWDAEMSGAILRNVDLGTWKVPASSYAAKDPKKSTTLYASDRDCFVALVDDSHPIEVPGNNGNETLFRGFIARNSETCAAAFDFWFFLYRFIYDNRIIWGLQSEKHLKIRHTSGGPMRFMVEAKPALERYVTASTVDDVAAIRSAQEKQIGDSKKDVSAWLRARGFTATQSTAIAEKAEEEPGDARSAWNLVNAATSLAHEIKFGDERVAFERQAAKILDVVPVAA